MRKSLFFILTVLTVHCFSQTSVAPDTSEFEEVKIIRRKKDGKIIEPGFETHDGFYLSLNLGFSNTPVSQTVTDTETEKQYNYKYTGPDMIVDLKIGGSPTENVVLFFSEVVMVKSSPSVTTNDIYYKINGETQDIGLLGVGGGLGYYYKPLNAFVLGSGGISSFTMTALEDSRTPRIAATEGSTGNFFEVKLGKEWWVSKNWGLGIAASYYYFNINSTKKITDIESEFYKKSLSNKMTTHAFAILFNTTFN